jgi:FeS assembly SUF system protein
MDNNFLELEEAIVKMLRTVYDPEIPVNIYDLGLVYGVDIDDDRKVTITMTFTAPACPAADFIAEDVKQRIETIEGVSGAEVKIVFEPEWHQGMMSEEAKLELGFL